METARRANLTKKVQTLVEHGAAEAVQKMCLGGNCHTVFYIYLVSICISVTKILATEIKVPTWKNLAWIRRF